MTAVLLSTRTPWWEYAACLKNFRHFKTHGHLKGLARREVTYGQLPDEYLDSVDSARYVVYSYATPIAWFVPSHGPLSGHWVQPDVKYSHTTTCHQNKIAVALENRNSSVVKEMSQ